MIQSELEKLLKARVFVLPESQYASCFMLPHNTQKLECELKEPLLSIHRKIRESACFTCMPGSRIRALTPDHSRGGNSTLNDRDIEGRNWDYVYVSCPYFQERDIIDIVHRGVALERIMDYYTHLFCFPGLYAQSCLPFLPFLLKMMTIYTMFFVS